MKFSLKNVGKIKEADIELNGLTVLAGLNDTGKSFITKTIFGVIKTISESNTQLRIEQFELIQSSLNQIYQSLRPIFTPITGAVNRIYPPNVTNQIAAIFSAPNNALDNSFILQLLESYEATVNAIFGSLPVSNLTPQAQAVKVNVDANFRNLFSKIKIDSGEEENCKRYFDRGIVKKFFQGQISRIGTTESTSIRLIEQQNELLNIYIANNVVSSFEIKDILPLKEATLIETPTILQLAKFINSTILIQSSPFNRRIAQQRAELPYHIYDLIEKMYLNQPIQNEKYSELYSKISSVIGGKVILEPSDLSFSFVKNNSHKIKSFNIASGVKSFGIIQLLLNSGAIANNSILVIDEPEVHLHPKWEIEYARIIIAMAEASIPILISSHSPYFIEAISKYSELSSIKDKTKFYFGKELEDGFSKFEDVSNDLTPIFKALADPFKSMQGINV